MEQTSLAKAALLNLDKAGSQPIKCMFNPQEYTFSKSNSWTTGGAGGGDLPLVEFGSGQPATLQMELFFDTYATQADVRAQFTDAIWELMLVDDALKDPKTQRSRPPMVRFQWGKSWSFDAVITSISQRFTLFLSDGTPVRATLNVSFQQVKDSKQLRPQNPTSGGVGGERVWRVESGDTLAWIAYKSYGNPTRWRRIAEANRLRDVRRLAPGTLLVVPND